MDANMTSRPRTAPRRWFSLALAAVAAAACERTPTPPVDDLEVAALVIADAEGTVHAYTHIDHWEGLIEIVPDQQRDFRVYLSAREGSDLAPPPRAEWFTLEDKPEYTLRVAVNDSRVAAWEGDRHAVTITGRRAGTTIANLAVRRGNTTLYEVPALLILVLD